MNTAQTYRALAAEMQQRLWTADTVDACREIELTIAGYEQLAADLEDEPRAAVSG
jgi:hypothetical protein